MSYNITTCPRCGEGAYDPHFGRCLNDDCHSAPTAATLRLAFIAAASLMLFSGIASHWIF